MLMMHNCILISSSQQQHKMLNIGLIKDCYVMDG